MTNWHPRAGVALLSLLLLAACGEKEPIPIGAVGDLRTGGRTTDSGFRNGILLAEEAVNEHGGAGGRLLSTVFSDDRGDPNMVPKIVEKLISSRVAAIIGPNTSATTAAALPIVNRNKVLLFSPEATSSEFSGRDDYFVRNEVSEKVMAEALASHAVQAMKLRSVGVILDEKNRPFTRPFFESFQKKMAALGAEAEIVYPYFALEAAEAGRQVDAFLRRGGDAVLLVTDAADTRLLGQTVRQVRGDLPLLGTTWAVPPTGSREVGRLPEEMVFPCTFDPDCRLPAYLDFKQRYEKRFGLSVDYHAVHAYEAMTILAQAIAKTGRNPARIGKAVTGAGEYQGLQGKIYIDPYGECRREVFMLEEANGILRRTDFLSAQRR